MITTELTTMLGIKHPIIQAGMGPWSTTNLCIAVANSGGLGIISTSGLTMGMIAPQAVEMAAGPGITGTPYEVLKIILGNATKGVAESKGVIGINCMVSTEMVISAKELIQAVIDARNEDPAMRECVRVIITSAGDPLPWADTIKPSGVKWLHVIPSVRHAKRCEKAGVDAIIASGHEGGMHVAWEPVHSMVLVPAVVKAVDVPVIACGGFSDGVSLAAALAMGADGVQMGTRFIATQESDFVPLWKEQILKSGERDTIIARGIVGPGRYLKNKAAMELASITVSKSPGLFMGQADDLATTAPEVLTKEIEGWTAMIEGDTDEALWAGGEVAGRIEDLPKVQELIDITIKEAEDILLKLPHKVSS
ncbi:MAG: nitronate monooxygenase [Chloroflexota bacterium]|nr:nitronate monooxygenase [Chloroflexota bacterium]